MKDVVYQLARRTKDVVYRQDVLNTIYANAITPIAIDMRLDELIEEINKIPAAQIWTPINEKEPPRGNVLVTLACGRQCAVHECNWEDMKRRIEIYKGAQSALDRFFIDHTIAWAPMPEPYVSRIEKSQFLMEIDEW